MNPRLLIKQSWRQGDTCRIYTGVLLFQNCLTMADVYACCYYTKLHLYVDLS